MLNKIKIITNQSYLDLITFSYSPPKQRHPLLFVCTPILELFGLACAQGWILARRHLLLIVLTSAAIAPLSHHAVGYGFFVYTIVNWIIVCRRRFPRIVQRKLLPCLETCCHCLCTVILIGRMLLFISLSYEGMKKKINLWKVEFMILLNKEKLRTFVLNWKINEHRKMLKKIKWTYTNVYFSPTLALMTSN